MRKDIHNSDIPAVCIACEARHRGVCGALSPEQLRKLNKFTSRELVAPGTRLSYENESSERYGNILHGVAKLVKILEDGRQQIVGLHFPPDFLGRPFGPDHGLTVEVASEINICSFPKNILEEMISETPELEHRLHEQALRELDDARNWMLTLGRKNASEKVASFICWIAEHAYPEQEKGDEIAFELPLKRAEMADFLGLTIETVSRQMTKLRQAGIIDLDDRKTVRVLALPKLKKACGR